MIARRCYTEALLCFSENITCWRTSFPGTNLHHLRFSGKLLKTSEIHETAGSIADAVNRIPSFVTNDLSRLGMKRFQ